MTSAQVVETSVKVTPNSPSQDYAHPDDHNLHTYDMTPGFKPFTIYSIPKNLAFSKYNFRTDSNLLGLNLAVLNALLRFHTSFQFFDLEV